MSTASRYTSSIACRVRRRDLLRLTGCGSLVDRVADVDTARVLEFYVPTVPGGGGGVGSGYRLGPEVALTAAHVVSGLPLWRSDRLVPGDVDTPGVCRVRPLGEREWVPAVVAWRDENKDVA